jgi:16S rRNA (cytosine967-C5)-methyltransferase
MSGAALPLAREIAAHVLTRVERDGAFASRALDAEIQRWPQLDTRDVGLATELVYGVLRTRAWLEERLAELATKGAITLTGEARAHLLIGAYAIAFLERVPAFASVNEAVAGITRHVGPRPAGFANALLRGLAKKVTERGRPSLESAVVDGAPGWLRGALRRSLGRAGANGFLAAGTTPPPQGLALREGEDRDAWIERLRAEAPAGASIEPGRVSSRAILLRGAGDARRLPGCEEAWIAQEEGAQALALLVGAEPGERVLDACAGRGNKAWILAGEVGPSGAVIAADLHAAKLEALVAGPLGARVKETHAVDWTLGSGEVGGGFDRVLVDAPCSGIGTLRRRPEIAWSRTAEDVGRLADLQTAIARRAATRLRPGGHLTFAVCSVLADECEAVADRLAELGDADGRTLTPSPLPPASAALGLAPDATRGRLLPDVHGTDGYFVASFVVGPRLDAGGTEG